MGAQVALAGETLESRWTALAESAGEPPRQVDCVAPDGSPNVAAFVGIAGPYGAFESAPGIDSDLRKVVEISAYVGKHPNLSASAPQAHGWRCEAIRIGKFSRPPGGCGL